MNQGKTTTKDNSTKDKIKKNKITKDNSKKDTDKEDSLILLREKLIEKAKQFNLLNNTFMSVALKDKAACQHVIRVITGIPDLIVKEVRIQYRVSSLTSHDAILDILAEDSKKHLYNLEIQRKETVDHARRTRFYGSMIDSEYLKKGREYYEMPEVHIIYISETDLWKAGKTVYKVKKYFENTDVSYEDGIHVTYVNAAVDDGSKIADLMKYFKKADPEDMSQGELSKRIHHLKCEERGLKIMEDISKEIYEEGIEEGKKEGKIETKKKTAYNMRKKGYLDEIIADILEVSINTLQTWFSEKA